MSESGQEKRETSADIADEIRHAVGSMGDEMPYTVSAGTMRRVADRIEAAWKRERESVTKCNGFGNAAALLEALRALRDASRDFYNQILNSKYSGILDKYTCVKQGFPAVLDLRSAFPMANYALSAPPRNCDAMPWRKAFDEWRAKHHPHNPQTFNESYEATVAFMEWFTAPASEKGATA